MTPTGRRLSLALLWLAAIGGVAGSLVGVWTWRETESRRRGQVDVALLETAFRRQVSDLGLLADRVSSAWIDASEPPPAGARRRAATASWRRIQAALGSSDAPAGAVIAVYEERGEKDNEQELMLLGAASEDALEKPQALTLTHALPAGLLFDEYEQFFDESGLTLLTWFSPGADGSTRLNLLAPYVHGYLAEDAREETTDVLRLFHVSVDFEPPGQMAVALRLDMKAGSLRVDLPLRSLPAPEAEGDTRDWGEEVPAIAPTSFPNLRFPRDDPVPRAAVRSMTPTVPVGLTVLWVAALAALVAAGAAQVLARRREAAAPPDVAAEAAHEMRTPLTVMRGELEVALRRERPSAEYREALAACLDEVKGLQRLHDAVLLLSRAARRARAQEDVDMAAVAAAEVERVRESHPDREVTYEGPDDPLLVRGDPSLLARAVGNLLDNAARHSVAGGGVRTTVQAAGAVVAVVVEDDGPGIPRPRLERVFERFYRGPEVGQRGIPGSGLGLPIVRWIAQVHGGSIEADAAAQDRARFELRIPRAKP